MRDLGSLATASVTREIDRVTAEEWAGAFVCGIEVDAQTEMILSGVRAARQPPFRGMGYTCAHPSANARRTTGRRFGQEIPRLMGFSQGLEPPLWGVPGVPTGDKMGDSLAGFTSPLAIVPVRAVQPHSRLPQ